MSQEISFNYETDDWQSAIEYIGDKIESIARNMPLAPNTNRKDLFALAWQLKQVARKGTPSEGI